jgi:hypothetical protein
MGGNVGNGVRPAGVMKVGVNTHLRTDMTMAGKIWKAGMTFIVRFVGEFGVQ